MDLSEIFIVIVLYKSSLENSVTIQSLGDITEDNIELFIFDNSPSKQYDNDSFIFGNFKVNYYSDNTNPGLSAAYNLALNKCSKLNKKWILLLDQDTTFTMEYIKEIKNLNSINLPDSVVAILPRVLSSSNQRPISPVKIHLGGLARFTNIKSGIVEKAISGINSGTLVNVSYINSIGGFSSDYTLDMLDHWYFRKFFKDKKSVYLMHSIIYQDLSVFGNFEENVSYSRYKQMVKAELCFTMEEGVLSLLIFKIRLSVRVIKQLQFKNRNFYKFTLKQIFATM